jgi:hypothetical protein
MSDLSAIERIIASLNAHLFGGRLPRMKLRVHDEPSEALGICWPSRNVISLRRDALDLGQRDLCAVLVHECCHQATSNERVPGDHGDRWQQAMRRSGVNPHSDAVMPYGPLDLWMRDHRW